MTFPVSHKTVFLLDHSSYFAQSCNQPMEYDVFRSKGSGVIPAAPICKSLWTCNVESLLEYLRIVFDIYPKEKHVRIISGSSVLYSWDCADTISTTMQKLALLEPPKSYRDDSSLSVLHGLSVALECLREPTKYQQGMLEQGNTVWNRGRIICMTYLKSDDYIPTFEDYIIDVLAQHKMATSADTSSADNASELIVIS